MVGSEYTENNWYNLFEEMVTLECSISLTVILSFDEMTEDE
jgi:hypothetical protein